MGRPPGLPASTACSRTPPPPTILWFLSICVALMPSVNVGNSNAELRRSVTRNPTNLRPPRTSRRRSPDRRAICPLASCVDHRIPSVGIHPVRGGEQSCPRSTSGPFISCNRRRFSASPAPHTICACADAVAVNKATANTRRNRVTFLPSQPVYRSPVRSARTATARADQREHRSARERRQPAETIHHESDDRRQEARGVAAGVQHARGRRGVRAGGVRRRRPERTFGELREAEAQRQQRRPRRRRSARRAPASSKTATSTSPVIAGMRQPQRGADACAQRSRT